LDFVGTPRHSGADVGFKGTGISSGYHAPVKAGADLGWLCGPGAVTFARCIGIC
jgi:hypothetical protein